MNDKVKNVCSSSMLPRTRTVGISASFMYSNKSWWSMLLFSTTCHSLVRGLIVLMSPSMIFLAFDSIVRMKSDSCSSRIRTSNKVACFFSGMSWACATNVVGGCLRIDMSSPLAACPEKLQVKYEKVWKHIWFTFTENDSNQFKNMNMEYTESLVIFS
jgi:hypothetical protein